MWTDLDLVPKSGIAIYGKFQEIPPHVGLSIGFALETIESFAFGGKNIEGFLLGSSSDQNQQEFIWCPRSEPIVECGDDSTTMQRLVFHLFNFQEIVGTSHTPIERESTTTSIAHIDLVAGNWKITLQSLIETQECFKKLRAEGGYGLTHIGSLQKIDGASFSGQEAREILHALRFFFSFAKGVWCYPVCPVGFDDADNRVWELWSSPREAWNASCSSWFHPHHPAQLVALFPGFMARWGNEAWREALSEVLYWYLNSNNAARGIDAGIILTQSAIERFSYEYAVKDRKLIEANGFKNLKGGCQVICVT